MVVRELLVSISHPLPTHILLSVTRTLILVNLPSHSPIFHYIHSGNPIPLASEWLRNGQVTILANQPWGEVCRGALERFLHWNLIKKDTHIESNNLFSFTGNCQDRMWWLELQHACCYLRLSPLRTDPTPWEGQARIMERTWLNHQIYPC